MSGEFWRVWSEKEFLRFLRPRRSAPFPRSGGEWEELVSFLQNQLF